MLLSIVSLSILDSDYSMMIRLRYGINREMNSIFRRFAKGRWLFVYSNRITLEWCQGVNVNTDHWRFSFHKPSKNETHLLKMKIEYRIYLSFRIKCFIILTVLLDCKTGQQNSQRDFGQSMTQTGGFVRAYQVPSRSSNHSQLHCH